MFNVVGASIKNNKILLPNTLTKMPNMYEFPGSK